jgi:hypothetical protein
VTDATPWRPGAPNSSAKNAKSWLGITVAYFTHEAAICAWKQNAEHLAAQRLGIKRWYSR